MAFIKYLEQDEILEQNRVKDMDHIIQIHGVHSKVMKQHYELYLEIMRKRSPLSRVQREMIGVIVSIINECHY